MKYSRPRGTRDFLPEEMAARRSVEQRMRRVFVRFGYAEVATPTFEHLELITAKSGEEIVAHLYHFKDKGGRDLALRPELTAPVMRLYVNELQSSPKPLRLYYFGNCFRYERPQAGRYREFWQAGVELIGSSSPEAQAEVIALAKAVLDELGLRNYELHVGSVGVLRKFLEERGIAEGEQCRIMGIIDKGDEEQLEEELLKLGLSEEDRSAIAGVLELKGERSAVVSRAEELLAGREAALNELRELEGILDALESFGVREYTLNLGIARGLDYYTGMVFEIYASKLGAEKQICGGGSYSLAETFGGKPVATSGFAFGFDRIMLALEKDGVELGGEEGAKIMVIPFGEEYLDRAIEISALLRRSVACELEVMRRKVKKALSYASSKGIDYVVLVGEETERGRVLLKDMRSGEQREVDIEELERELAG
ncbi:MAG: histidine--tRNA ligase [Euryarchaeota archaeon]|nr:histidine--tRNA ligase [Euryarchaeota archaeon]